MKPRTIFLFGGAVMSWLGMWAAALSAWGPFIWAYFIAFLCVVSFALDRE